MTTLSERMRELQACLDTNPETGSDYAQYAGACRAVNGLAHLIPRLVLALEDCAVRFAKAAIVAGHAPEYVDIATSEWRTLLAEIEERSK